MSARDWKYFLLAWALVLLCATPAVFAQEPVLQVGVNDKNTYSIPSCDTKEQMLDVVNQPTPQAVRDRLAHYNSILDASGEPACGRIEAEIVILEVVTVKTIGDFTVTVVRFQPQGYPKPVFGITTFQVKQGTTV